MSRQPPRGGQSPVGPRPPAPGRFRAVFLAIAVHAAFFGLIIFGVNWQSRPAPPLQAEIWKDLPPATKPAPVKAEPEPEPPKPEPPKPEPPKPEPPKPEPPKPEVKPEPPRPDPRIAEKLEREKREKEKREKLDQEKKLKADREKEAKKLEEAKKKRDDDKRRADAERAKAEQAKAQEAAAAARKTEFDSYIDKIRNRIRSKANVPDTVRGNPRVSVRIKVLPGGDVLDVTVVRSSGNPAYDAAIERAIRSAQPLPVPAANSELFPQFRDLTLNIDHDR